MLPSRWRKAIASPAGDHTGEKEPSSSVTRRISAPVAPSRMTTSVPKLSVRVAAMYLPSGDGAGEM